MTPEERTLHDKLVDEIMAQPKDSVIKWGDKWHLLLWIVEINGAPMSEEVTFLGHRHTK